MTPLLQQVLTEIDQLDPSEQLSVMGRLVERLNIYVNVNVNATTLAAPRISRQELLGCAKGLISMSEDFDAPLADFEEYM